MNAGKRGFVLGKFLPPHAGHLFLCEAAARMVDEMTVLVCSIDAEPIAGALRAAWMRRLLPGLNVRHMHREIPQAPEDDPDFWPIWKAAIAEYHPQPIDCVFGSEPYVFRLARELGAEPVLIDPDREAVPVSSTQVREDPAGSWRFIPDVVRPYYQKRVCILGPESSGKSRLAADLAQRFGTLHMPEYGRIYDLHYRKGEGWSEADFVAIARAHVAMREVLGPHAGPVLIEDTDPIQTAIWAEHLLGLLPEAMRGLLRVLDRADLYLVLSPEVEWSDDGTRYAGSAETRAWFFTRCRQYLEEHKCHFVNITGRDWEVRRETAASHVAADFPGACTSPTR